MFGMRFDLCANFVCTSDKNRYCNTCLKRPLKKKTKFDFRTDYLGLVATKTVFGFPTK